MKSRGNGRGTLQIGPSEKKDPSDSKKKINGSPENETKVVWIKIAQHTIPCTS